MAQEIVKRRSLLSAGKNTLPRRIRQHWMLYVFLSFGIVWLLVFAYYPMYGAQIAFKDYKYNLGFGGSPWVGLKHFQAFLQDLDFYTVVRNTLSINGLKLLICFPAPILLALLINEVQATRFKKTVQTMSYLPYFVSWVVVISIMTAVFSPYGGIINNVRKSMGLESVFFMGRREYFFPMVILSDIWKGAGWGSIIYLAALTGISPELYEAARIDGAGKFKCVLHVTLPGIMGTIGIMLIMNIGNLLNLGLDPIMLFQQPDNYVYSEIIDTYVLKRGLQYGKFEYATAIGLTKSILALLLMALANFAAKKTMEVGLW
jgi:putative aldouronate transport system permease protein